MERIEVLSRHLTDTPVPSRISSFPLSSAGSDKESRSAWNIPSAVNILPEVSEIENEIIEIRRRIHSNPELCFTEFKTSEFILSKLQEFACLEITQKVAVTGIVALLRGNRPGKCVLLRADMDALPQSETNDLPFRSVTKNVMHACGHDAHVAMLLGAVKILCRERERLSGSVKFMFQPAEEGGGGANVMLKEGVLENPYVDEVYALHVVTAIPTYLMATQLGSIMAASDEFEIIIKGKGGHGSMPEYTKDAIVAASFLVTNLQTVVSRSIGGSQAAVVSVGTFNAGTNFQGASSYNIIADHAKLTGTIRCHSQRTRQTVMDRIKQICEGVGNTHSVKITFSLTREGYPSTVNNSQDCLDVCAKACVDTVGAGRVHTKLPTLPMGAEDMSFLLQERPGCYFFIGASPSKLYASEHPQHSPKFMIDERVLAFGTSVWVRMVRDMLGAQ
eukprot:199536_1